MNFVYRILRSQAVAVPCWKIRERKKKFAVRYYWSRSIMERVKWTIEAVPYSAQLKSTNQHKQKNAKNVLLIERYRIGELLYIVIK